MAYSLVALQEMNLAYRFPIIFWNCACLISDSGGIESETDEEENSFNDFESNELYENEIESFLEDKEDDDEEENKEDVTQKKKKKVKTTNYGKVATAIGKMKKAGIEVAPPDINHSAFTFSPDVENSTIRFGLSGIARVSQELIQTIIANRPYTSISDFLSKVKVNKPQMINLIKSGAFDSFGDRVELMHEYVNLISDTKKRITLQNMKMLIDFGLIPEEYDMVRRIFNFNKYLKKLKEEDVIYLDNIAFAFYEKNFSIDALKEDSCAESGFSIPATKWKPMYDKWMDKIRPWVKANATELLEKVNNQLTKDVWDKYCTGSISKWEMDSVSCYFHEHELARVNPRLYDFSNFFALPAEPEISHILRIKGKEVPIYKIHRIYGTVLDRDKMKKTISLLTPEGVVSVKIFGDVFSYYDRQISERDADGKKKILEKSIFARGNKIIITGIRRDDSFQGKKYKSTQYHLVELIESVEDNGRIKTRARSGQEE